METKLRTQRINHESRDSTEKGCMVHKQRHGARNVACSTLVRGNETGSWQH